ncbi:aspartate/glutamate racemase family protein [Pseudogracilibacillus sp. SO30301A]|uniref:aspartate/glutamate racemase family protein n=1 Tax=Pseudogracilibacillus sp. SO30301A TaxID=3098291 RepID=UPI00300DDB84
MTYKLKNAKLGILMLDNHFHRPVGDIGNKDTFSFPVAYKTVVGATINRAVREADAHLVAAFIKAAKEFEQEGIQAISTSCGFLAIFQKEIQTALHVPFLSSSLLQIPFISMIAGEPIGVITASKTSLTTKHLNGVNALGYQLVIEGMDEMSNFTGAIIDEMICLNETAVYGEMKQVTTKLIKENPDLKAIVLECTNMPPYLRAIREITNIPIFDCNTLIESVYRSLPD